MLLVGKVIDCLLYFKGSFKRSDLCDVLSISPASATREIKRYREDYDKNINYDVSARRYSANANFEPVYKHDSHFALNLIFKKRIVIELPGGSDDRNEILTELPAQFPKQDIVAKLTRACIQTKPLQATYFSTSGNEEPFRTIIPTRLFYVGGFWYVRAFSQKGNKPASYRSLKLVRFASVSPVLEELKPAYDVQWNSKVTLTLAPHSKHEKSESLRLDLGLKGKPVVNITTNEVLAGFVLQSSNVDCSKEASLSPKSFQYQLMNRHELLNVDSMIIAPGFVNQK